MSQSECPEAVSRSPSILSRRIQTTRKPPEPAREAASPDAPRPRRRPRDFPRRRSAAAGGSSLSRDRAHFPIACGLAAQGQVDAQGGEAIGREKREKKAKEREKKSWDFFDGRSQEEKTLSTSSPKKTKNDANPTTRSAPPRGLSPSWPHCWASRIRQ